MLGWVGWPAPQGGLAVVAGYPKVCLQLHQHLSLLGSAFLLAYPLCISKATPELLPWVRRGHCPMAQGSHAEMWSHVLVALCLQLRT